MEHAAQVENVLVNEIDNQNGVHLYLEGNKWCAYERSAYYLAQLKDILKKDCYLTDVGSTRTEIHEEVIRLDMEDNFIGGTAL